MESLCTAKDIIICAKAQPRGWEETFSNHISDIGLGSRIHRKFKIYIYIKKTTQIKMLFRLREFSKDEKMAKTQR